MSLEGKESPPNPCQGLAGAGTARWGWFNVNGIQGSLEEVLEFMNRNRLLFLVLGETWLRPADSLRHPAIVIDHRYPREEFSKGRGVHGLMVLRNPQLTESSDFAEVFRDEVNYTCVWFRFRSIVVGGYYLPPSLDLTICRESLLKGFEYVEDQNRNVFLVGDLNMRMGTHTGDSIANTRSQLWYTIEEMGLYWLQPDEGKWTVDTTRGQSIVDYVFANPQAQRLVKSTKVWEAEWVAGSDHRVISCDTECDNHLDEAVLSPPNSISRSSQCIWKIKSSDLDNPDAQETVRRQFDTNGTVTRAMVEKEVGHLVWGGGLYMRDQAMATPTELMIYYFVI